MKKLFKRFVSFIGYTFLLLLLIISVVSYKWFRVDVETIDQDTILELTLDQRLQERPSARHARANKPLSNSVRDIIDALDTAATNDHVKALVVYAQDGIFSGVAQIQELRGAIHRFRQAGKKTYFYTDSFGEFSSGLGLYYLAAAFDEILIHPIGTVSINGLAVVQPFARKLLDDIGIEPEIERREAYKTAFDGLQEYTMTEANRQETQDLLTTLVNQMATSISQEREIAPAIVTELMQGPPLYQLKQAQDEGLIDGTLYERDMRERLKKSYGEKVKFADLAKVSLTQQSLEEPINAKVAVIFADGVVARQASGRSALMSTGGMEVEAILDALKDVAHRESVKAVVVRINTPGGAPSVGDDLWAAIKKVTAHKPVIISMGDVAASAGYWMAMASSPIVANPATVTGSIGVILAKFATQKFWEKIGVHWEKIQTSPYAGLTDIVYPFTPAQKEWVKNQTDFIYQAFIDKVKEGRHLTQEQVQAVAKGRVWTGQQALERGLIDKIGDLEEAIKVACAEAKLVYKTKKDVQVIYLPKPATFLEKLSQFLKGDLPFGALVQSGIRQSVEAVQQVLTPLTTESRSVQARLDTPLPTP